MRAFLLIAALALPLTALAQDQPAAPPAPPSPPALAQAPAPPAPPTPPAQIARALPAPPATPAPEPPAAPLPPAPPAWSANAQAVHAAVEDYLLGFYHAEPARLERSLHPNLQKVGYWRDPEGAYHYSTMSYDQALSLAARWNVDGGQTTADSPRDIVLLEVNDQTAIAKLTAVWGIDYFQLGQFEGEWKIINVIWQSPPPSSDS
jgi:hypothetical protein